MKIIDFTDGINPLGPSNKAKNAIRSHVRHISTVDDTRLGRLRSNIAKKEGIDTTCIAFGCGSTAILSAILESTKLKKTLLSYPISQRHRTILSRHGIETVIVPLRADDNFELNIDRYRAAMDGCDAAMLSNPHDVTGSIMLPEDIVQIIDDAERLGIHLFLDESYGEYTGMPSLASRVVQSGKTSILRTFSTFHALGGLRLGYAIGSPELVKMIENGIDPSWINDFAPKAALASMKDKGYRRRTLLFIENEKAYLRKKLAEVEGIKCFVSPSNMLVIRLQKNRADLSGSFRKFNMLVHIFTDDSGNDCIQFPVQTHRLNAYFVRSLKRILEA